MHLGSSRQGSGSGPEYPGFGRCSAMRRSGTCRGRGSFATRRGDPSASFAEVPVLRTKTPCAAGALRGADPPPRRPSVRRGLLGGGGAGGRRREGGGRGGELGLEL